jgi:hypothetical protein
MATAAAALARDAELSHGWAERDIPIAFRPQRVPEQALRPVPDPSAPFAGRTDAGHTQTPLKDADPRLPGGLVLWPAGGLRARDEEPGAGGAAGDARCGRATRDEPAGAWR